MSDSSLPNEAQQHGSETGAVEMPQPTVAPMLVSLGVALMGAGVAMSVAFLAIGTVLLVIGLAVWIGQMLPGRGHDEVPRVAPSMRPAPVARRAGSVQTLDTGMPGYRLRLPEQVHPISAGVKGGIVGGLVMPLPALLYGLLSGKGIWLPVNLLAGMALPGVGQMSADELGQFHLSLLLLAVVIHAAISVVLGLMYGVMLPTLPSIPKPLAWGGLLMPLLWTAVSFCLMGLVNSALQAGVDWPWFILSQFLFGVVAAIVVIRAGAEAHPVAVGLRGGLVGGVLMPLPAVIWSLFSGHGIWYPVNLLAGMVLPAVGKATAAELEAFSGQWFAVGLAIHAAMSAGFGILYGRLLPNLPMIPGPLAWGGLMMPLLWTATSYGLMGVVNPPLQHRVDWPWFVVSQFVFGLVGSIVVVRSEMVYVPPAGSGPEKN